MVLMSHLGSYRYYDLFPLKFFSIYLNGFVFFLFFLNRLSKNNNKESHVGYADFKLIL